MKLKRFLFNLLFCCFAVLATSSLRAQDFPRKSFFETRVKGLGRFTILTDGGLGKYTFSIQYFHDGSQWDEHKAVAYSSRARLTRDGMLPPKTEYKQCVVSISCRDANVSLTYYLYPRFSMSRGFYLHEEVVASMPLWKSIFKLAPEREYSFRFVPDSIQNRTMIYLDGSLAGYLDGVVAVTGVQKERPRHASQNLEILSEHVGTLRESGLHELPSLPFRANSLLLQDASLSVGYGEQVIEGIPMTVWPPDQSIDQGRHRQTTTHRDLGWNPMFSARNPWSVGLEYMMWKVPGLAWRYAYILCADIPDAAKEPVVGTQFALFDNACSAGNVNFSTLSLKEFGKNPNIRKVGTLTYRKDSQTVTTPLYMVRMLLDFSKLGPRAENASILDFEFVGCGTWPGYKRSSVQIFGCTLRETPYTYSIHNDVRGNIFEIDRTPRAAGIDLMGTVDNAKGTLSYEIYDPYFKTLKRDKIPFLLPKARQVNHIEIDLSQFPVGWYGMDYSFSDHTGSPLYSHTSSFTVLAPDDREAGFDSPYAAWPHLKGGHNNNPDPLEQLEVMRKAGYHKSWHPPCESEEASGDYKITFSELGDGYQQPGKPLKSRAELDSHFDKAVQHYREILQRFPHCNHIMMLHEQGGRGIAPEVTGTKPAIRGVYRGWDFDTPGLTDQERGEWDVFYCTEYCKRMHKEFPDMKIVAGNGSSSSEKIASLIRRGFDLSLVDQLGIESKGFGTLPEFNANREAPGMLWALRETGRVFGYNHFTMNCCNEYVFRPERVVSRNWDIRKIMRVTDYTVRDYLISLAYGCDKISTGHLEDSNTSYYDTNWGAGGQCTFYPFSYPKRMYTALAVLTRVLDKPEFSRRLPSGEITSYILEFKRNRTIKDFAYALWTPHYGSTVSIRFPHGTPVKKVDIFGKETVLSPNDNDEIILDIDSSPSYLIASTAALSATVIGHAKPEIPPHAKAIGQVHADSVRFAENPKGAFGGWEVPQPLLGTFELKDVRDEETKQPALEVRLVKKGTVAPVMWEYTELTLQQPFVFNRKATDVVGIMVRGNSSFSQLELKFRDPKNPKRKPWIFQLGDERSYITFEGWQFLSARLPEKVPAGYENTDELEVCAIVCGSARKALDPVEMADVTEPIRLGPVMVSPKTSTSAADVEAEKAEDAMKSIDDKDW